MSNQHIADLARQLVAACEAEGSFVDDDGDTVTAVSVVIGVYDARDHGSLGHVTGTGFAVFGITADLLASFGPGGVEQVLDRLPHAVSRAAARAERN